MKLAKLKQFNMSCPTNMFPATMEARPTILIGHKPCVSDLRRSECAVSGS